MNVLFGISASSGIGIGRAFVIPESEMNPVEISKTLKWTKASYAVGAVVFALMMLLWVVPYLRGLR